MLYVFFFTIFHGIQRILIFQDPKNYKISTNFGDLINKQFFDIVDFRSINEESPKFKSIKCGIRFISTLQQQQPHSKTPPKYVYLNGQPIIDEPCKVSSKGCVCVTSFKCCHVGGVSKVLFYSTILIDYSLEWLENDDIKVFFFWVPGPCLKVSQKKS